MKLDINNINRRVLVVDDSSTIHHDFQTILAPKQTGTSLASAEAELFG